MRSAAWRAGRSRSPAPARPAALRGGEGEYQSAFALAAAVMAKVLAAKGHDYQSVFTRNARHRPTVAQTLPAAMEWLWKGHPIP